MHIYAQPSLLAQHLFCSHLYNSFDKSNKIKIRNKIRIKILSYSTKITNPRQTLFLPWITSKKLSCFLLVLVATKKYTRCSVAWLAFRRIYIKPVSSPIPDQSVIGSLQEWHHFQPIEAANTFIILIISSCKRIEIVSVDVTLFLDDPWFHCPWITCHLLTTVKTFSW